MLRSNLVDVVSTKKENNGKHVDVYSIARCRRGEDVAIPALCRAHAVFPPFSLSQDERARGPVSEHDVTRHASTPSRPQVFLDPSITFLLYLTFSFLLPRENNDDNKDDEDENGNENEYEYELTGV